VADGKSRHLEALTGRLGGRRLLGARFSAMRESRPQPDPNTTDWNAIAGYWLSRRPWSPSSEGKGLDTIPAWCENVRWGASPHFNWKRDTLTGVTSRLKPDPRTNVRGITETRMHYPSASRASIEHRLGRPDLARIGPTTPTRTGRLADASVDPTEARSLLLFGSRGRQTRRWLNRAMPARPARRRKPSSTFILRGS
jgi:hypothetical protein